MKVKRIVLFFLIFFFSQNVFSCFNLEVLKKIALKENKLIIAYVFKYEDNTIKRDVLPFLYLENNEIADNNFYLYDSVLPNEDFKIINKKYLLNNTPAILIIDGKGNELYKTFDVFNKNLINEMLLNFSFYKNVFANEFNNLSQKENFATATRIAQKYYDFSLIVDKQYKEKLIIAAENYISIAQNKLPKNKEKCCLLHQKAQLIKLNSFAFNKDFERLSLELQKIEENTVFEENSMQYYFLKYISSKALKSDDFSVVEEKVKSIDGFDYYIKKADLILNQHDLVVN